MSKNARQHFAASLQRSIFDIWIEIYLSSNIKDISIYRSLPKLFKQVWNLWFQTLNGKQDVLNWTNLWLTPPAKTFQKFEKEFNHKFEATKFESQIVFGFSYFSQHISSLQDAHCQKCHAPILSCFLQFSKAKGSFQTTSQH